MKNKIIVSIIIIILALSVSYIFTAGNFKYQKASEGIVDLGFTSSKQALSIPDFEILNIIIENRNPSEITFNFRYYINNNEIVAKEVSVPKNTQQIIAVPEEIKNYITVNPKPMESLRYEIKVSWNGKEENLYKSININ